MLYGLENKDKGRLFMVNCQPRDGFFLEFSSLEIAEKKIEEVKIVVSGAGAAAISCSRLYQSCGAKQENMVMLDSKGVIRKDRENLTSQKAEFASFGFKWSWR